MKCANPNCHRGIGLVSYRRHAFSKNRYCSRKCRDTLVAERANPPPQRRRVETYFEWLFEQPVPVAQLRSLPAHAPVPIRNDLRRAPW